MSPINTLSVLAFASAVVAVPYHGHGHPRHHVHRPSGFSGFPYPSANATQPLGSTGFATSTGLPTNVAPVPVGPATAESSTSESTIVEPSTYYNVASGTICTTDVTVTSKVQVTVTVTATADAESSPVSEASVTDATSTSSRAKSTVHVTSTVTQPAYSASSASSSSEAAPVEETSSGAPTPPAYTAPASTSSSSSSEVAPVETSASSSEVAPPAYSTPAPTTSSTTSSEAASVSETSTSTSEQATSTMAPTSYSVPNKAPSYSSATSSSAAAATTSAASYSSGGKRGVAYNDASLTECFEDSPSIGWGYNWGSASDGLSSSFTYIPQLWGPTSDFTNDWSSNAQSAIDSGSTHLFSFNEPDLSSQCNLSPQEAADNYKTYMEPFAGKAKLCAPSVTNGGGNMGLTWLSNFLAACSDCTIDCVNIHWYDSAENSEYFKDQVKNATEISGGKPVFVSEFGATGSDDQISSFLEDVMPWMDSEDSVAGYAYFMVSDGLLVTGTEPSSYGQTYAS